MKNDLVSSSWYISIEAFLTRGIGDRLSLHDKFEWILFMWRLEQIINVTDFLQQKKTSVYKTVIKISFLLSSSSLCGKKTPTWFVALIFLILVNSFYCKKFSIEVVATESKKHAIWTCLLVHQKTYEVISYNNKKESERSDNLSEFLRGYFRGKKWHLYLRYSFLGNWMLITQMKGISAKTRY